MASSHSQGMNIQLTWDLFIIVFTAIITAYSFIIGRRQTIKIIMSVYVAFLAADGLGFFIKETLGFRIPAIAFGFDPASAAIVTTILLFILFIVILARHNSFDVLLEDESGGIPYFLSTSYTALLCSLLMVACMLFFLSGNTFAIVNNTVNPTSINVLSSQSHIAKWVVDYFHVWFFLPAFSLIFFTFVQKKA